jgi:hypothetical protein
VSVQAPKKVVVVAGAVARTEAGVAVQGSGGDTKQTIA